MRASKKAYYGLRAAAALGKHGGELSVHELARVEEMPEDYLHKILQSLRKAGLVMAAKGQGGGYSLARDAAEISDWGRAPGPEVARRRARDLRRLAYSEALAACRGVSAGFAQPARKAMSNAAPAATTSRWEGRIMRRFLVEMC